MVTWDTISYLSDGKYSRLDNTLLGVLEYKHIVLLRADASVKSSQAKEEDLGVF